MIKINVLIPVLSLCVITYCSNTLARPISYPGGWTWMQTQRHQSNRIHLHYSPTYQYSLGVAIEQFLSKETHTVIQLNRLLYRRNTRYTQLNSYIKQSYGLSSCKQQVVGAIQWALDWESRRLYSAAHLDTHFGSATQTELELTLGLAPYLAPYNALHTWFLMRLNSTTHHTSLTPTLRLFYRSVLFELGYHPLGKVYLNSMIRF